jgi:hypothetical protein
MKRTRLTTALVSIGALLVTAAGPSFAAGGPPDGMGGGGGEDTGAGNNLSYPVVWSETGYALPLRGAMDAPVIDGSVVAGTFSTDDLTPCLAAVQDDALTTWQAGNTTAPAIPVTIVDWGDKLEARDAGSQQQAIRVETSLYAAADPAMTRYEMCYVSGQGPDEIWGLRVTEVPGALPDDPVTYAAVTTKSGDAMVYTAGARLTIQRIVPGRSYTWDPAGHRWTGSGADDPDFNAAVHEETSDGPGSYGAEVTVSGKITYGYNWMTSGLPQGEYRLTFSLDGPTGTFPGSGTSLATAQLLVSEETAALPEVRAEDGGEGSGSEGGEGMGNTAIIVGALNLTYIDIGLGTRTDPVPPLDDDVTPPSGGTPGGSTPTESPTEAAGVPDQQSQAAQGPTQVATTQQATARTAQTARIRAQASGRYSVGAVLVLARKAVKTSAGVTVRWRATTQSRDVCRVRTVNGRSTATLVRPGTCTVFAWAPAPSPNYLPYRSQRTYRAVR